MLNSSRKWCLVEVLTAKLLKHYLMIHLVFIIEKNNATTELGGILRLNLQCSKSPNMYVTLSKFILSVGNNGYINKPIRVK